MTFHDYIVNWFGELVDEHKEDKEWLEDLFHQLGYNEAEYIDEGETCYDFLMAMSDENEIYESLFGYSAKVKDLDDLPDTYGFLKDMFYEVGKDLIKKYDFAEDLLEDMAATGDSYTNLIGFFEDLQTGGCASGMIGMFIYNDDCKKFYIDHIDDMDYFVEDLGKELGEPVTPGKDVAHRYVWVCWLCYEELAFKIARELWEDKF